MRIARECCFHTKRETNVCILLIHACKLGGADQQCIFSSWSVCISCGLHRSLHNIQHYFLGLQRFFKVIYFVDYKNTLISMECVDASPLATPITRACIYPYLRLFSAMFNTNNTLKQKMKSGMATSLYFIECS